MGMNFFVRAIGFFNDAYDLFVMNIVNVILEEQYGDAYTPTLKSMVSTGVFVGSVLGQLMFGYYADRLGRKRIMVLTAILLIIGGILCTSTYGGSVAGTLWLLAIYRAILGIGIGGEYPLSCTYTAEGSKTSERGRNVSSTFSMQGLGQVAAAFIGNLLVQNFANSRPYVSKNLELIWRMLFGIGTIPALLILYPRYRAEENVHFKTNQFATATFQSGSGRAPQSINSRHNAKGLEIGFIWRHYWRRLIGTAGTWFLFDIVFYANGIFAASVLHSLNFDTATRPSLQTVTLQNLYIALGALPGYYVAIWSIDWVGRKRMQLQGFVCMTVIYSIMGIFWSSISSNGPLFVSLYALSFFFSNFGPNTTTFLLPVEAYPTPLRATCHGFSAAMGKVGAFVGTVAFKPMEEAWGVDKVFVMCALVCFVSIPITYFFVEDRTGELILLDIEFQKFLDLDEHEVRHKSSTAFSPTMPPGVQTPMVEDHTSSPDDSGNHYIEVTKDPLQKA